jgi:hypothetical protein
MENKFYNELRKFKKAEKVELGLVEDITKAISATEDILNGIESSVSFAEKIAKQRLEILKDLPKLQKEANNVFDKGAKFLDNAQRAAKELGIKTSDVKNYDKLEKKMNQLARDIDSVIRAQRNLK